MHSSAQIERKLKFSLVQSSLIWAKLNKKSITGSFSFFLCFLLTGILVPIGPNLNYAWPGPIWAKSSYNFFTTLHYTVTIFSIFFSTQYLFCLTWDNIQLQVAQLGRIIAVRNKSRQIQVSTQNSLSNLGPIYKQFLLP